MWRGIEGRYVNEEQEKIADFVLYLHRNVPV